MRRTGVDAPNRRARTGRGVRLPVRGPVANPAQQGSNGASGKILVGRFGTPQGVRGQIRVQSFCADPLSIGAYGALSDATGARTFVLRDVRVLKDAMLVATVEGVADRDAAAALTGTELFAARENLPPADEDEFYLADLVGIDAVDEAGAVIGTIVAVQNFGAGDILEVRPVAGGETLLVPFTKIFVPKIDLAAKRVVMVVPMVDIDEGA